MPVAGDEAAPAASVRGGTHSLCSSVPEMSDEDCPRCGPTVEGLFETGSDTEVEGHAGAREHLPWRESDSGREVIWNALESPRKSIEDGRWVRYWFQEMLRMLILNRRGYTVY